MPSLIESLPGQVLPIAELNSTLAKMWQPDAPEGEGSSEFRASQMNLILHFGKKVTADEAREKFDIAIEFAQRTPCRIILICPEMNSETSERPLEAKLYSECFLGTELRNMCCVEVLMLAYHIEQKNFMDNQVSVWLENDLPIYYWFVRMPTERIHERFMPFLKRCRRVVYDSSLEEDDYTALDWSQTTELHDIAHARMLPLRQGLGQYMSGFEPRALVEGLRAIHVRYCPCMRGEARCMKNWFVNCIESCLAVSRIKTQTPFTVSLEPTDCETLAVELRCEYDKVKHFTWRLERSQSHAHLSSNFGNGENEQTMYTHLLAPEKALSEALFFG